MEIQQKKLAVFLILVLAICTALSACSAEQAGIGQSDPTALPNFDEPGLVTAEGWAGPIRYSALSFMTGGELSEILINEGQEVHQGDILARVGDLETLEASLSQAELERLVAQQALDDLKKSSDLARTQSALALVAAEQTFKDTQNNLDHLDTSDFQDELDERYDAVADAKEEMDDAWKELGKHLDLDPDNWTRKNAQEEYDEAKLAYQDALYDYDKWQNQLNQAKAAVNLARAQLEEARRAAYACQDGLDPDDLELGQTRLDNAIAQVAAVKVAMDNLELVAPYDATVVDVSEIEPGERVAPGAAILILADYSSWIVQTRDLTELDVVKVEIGQDVSVIPDALPEVKLAGVVESIDQAFTERSGDILYAVHIRLEQVDPLLRWGMTVTVTFK